MPNRAARPISVHCGTKLLEECTSENYGEVGGYRSRSWSGVVNAYLSGYNGYRDASLVFEDPNGGEVRSRWKTAINRVAAIGTTPD